LPKDEDSTIKFKLEYEAWENKNNNKLKQHHFFINDNLIWELLN
jgi:hypothetical protein